MELVERAHLTVATVRLHADTLLSRVAMRSAGQSTVEYGLLIVLVSTVLVLGYFTGLPSAVSGLLDAGAELIPGAI